MKEIIPGSIVYLKSDTLFKIPMTVMSIETDTKDENNLIVWCQWFTSNKCLLTECFNISSLQTKL